MNVKNMNLELEHVSFNIKNLRATLMPRAIKLTAN